MGGATRPALVLVVGEDPVRVRRWTRWLEQAGFATTTCPGPEVTWSCPRLDGEPCPRREMVDVAVVAVGPGAEGVGVCTKVPDDGRTVVLGEADVSIALRERGIEIRQPSPALLVEHVRRALGGPGEPRPRAQAGAGALP
jgi:hypothetical protein